MLDWGKFTAIAEKFQHKAKREDREDLRQTIILRLAEVASNNGHKPLSEPAMLRIASLTVAQYWRSYYYQANGIDCGHCSNLQRKKCKENNHYAECPRAIRIESLNQPIVDEDGHITELGNLIADDKAIDLDAWLDANIWLYRAPVRLVSIAYKKANGLPLTDRERNYLYHERKKAQKSLPII